MRSMIAKIAARAGIAAEIPNPVWKANAVTPLTLPQPAIPNVQAPMNPVATPYASTPPTIQTIAARAASVATKASLVKPEHAKSRFHATAPRE